MRTRIWTAALSITVLSLIPGCQGERTLEPVSDTPTHPELKGIAVRVLVDLKHGEISVLPSTGTATHDSGGPNLAILGANEVAITTSNLVRSAPANNKVTVTFDAALTNRLTSASLVPSTFPGTAPGILLFPFQVTQAVGGAASQVAASTDWNGDGSAGSGAPRNFFNDFGCLSAGATSDCYRWEQYPAPLGPGETTVGRKVGFTLPKAITSFTVLLVLAADISSDLPAVAHIVVTPPSYVMNDGFPATFSAVAYDALNNPLSWPSLKWTTADITALEFQYGSALVGTITGSSQVVHGRKVGQTSFTVSSGGVSVVVPVDIQVNTIVLVQPYILPDSELTVGEQVQAQASVKDNSGQIVPGFDPTWSTSDPNVATVDPATGLISAVGPGTCNIIATAAGAAGSIPITVDAASLGSIDGTVSYLWAFLPAMSGARVDAVLGGLTFTTSTDGSGHYSFPSVPVGQYQVTVHRPTCSLTFSSAPFLVTAGQTTVADFFIDCPPVVNGRVTEAFGNPLPGGLSMFFVSSTLFAIVPVQPNGSYTATITAFVCGSFCSSGNVNVSLGMPASCSLLSGPDHVNIGGPESAYTLADYSIDCRARGTVVVDLTLTGNPLGGPIDFSLTGPLGPQSQVQIISATGSGPNPFPATAPGDYTVDLSALPRNCSAQGPTSQSVTLAPGGTEQVAMTVACR